MAAVQFKDYYKTLGVDRNADEKTIRSAYRKLARKHHPDINPGDKEAEERFKEINEAHEVLSDPEKRKMYDRYGEDWQRYRDAGFTGDEPAGQAGRATDFGTWFTGHTAEQRGGRQAPEYGTFTVDYGDGEGGAGFSDFFQTLFGNMRGRTGTRGTTHTYTSTEALPRRGLDQEVDIDVSFDEAVNGGTRMLQVQTNEPCPRCHGSGIVRGAPCPTCDGTGFVPRAKTIEVRVPKGVDTGSRIRVAGQGGPGVNGGPPGDVYLRVNMRPDPRFERHGDDLQTDVPVPLYTAILGGEVVVPTPTGRVALTIPAGTQADRIFRLRGQGMPKLRRPKERGDLLARVKVKLPTQLSDRERTLFTELRELSDGKKDR